MKMDNALRMVGIATKAGRIDSGEFMTENAVKSGRAALVIIAGDASKNTKKKFNDMCKFYEVPIRAYSTKEELGRAIGKEFRASIAVTDEGLAQAIMKKMN